MLLEKQASSPFVSLTVLTGKVTSLTPGSQGSAEVEVSVIKVYKAGRLKFRKRGPTTSATLSVTCMKCPALRKGERNTHKTSSTTSSLARLIFYYCMTF